MTGNDAFALPLGLMGMHKSAWSLCSLLCAELGDACCHKAKGTIRTLACPICCSLPLLNGFCVIKLCQSS